MRDRANLEGLDLLNQMPSDWRDGIAAAESAAALPENGWTALQQAQAVDIADWLPNDLLVKLDRCLMAQGVEGRVPFLDPRLASFGFNLPDRLKMRGGRGKWILRKWLDGVLPEADAFSPKRGFSVPVGDWIFAEGSRIGPLVADQPGVQEICRPDQVRKLFKAGGKRQAQAAWMLLFYACWHQHHILGSVAEGDVSDLLGEVA